MAQLKIYGARRVWGERRQEVSDALHAAVVQAWGLPEDKRFHRFVLLDDDDLVVPTRSAGYLVVELICFTGRSRRAKRALIAAMYDDVAPLLGLDAADLELVILESPAENWGIRGMSGDELTLGYVVEV